MSTYAWNTSSTPNSVSDNKNNESAVCRIYTDPNIKKTLKLDELYISEAQASVNKTIDAVGLSFPLICINNNILKATEIEYMEISCDKFLPNIYLKINPKTENLINKDAPKDGDIISVFIRCASDLIVPLRCDFIINSSAISKSIETKKQITSKLTLSGELFVPGINSQSSSFAYQGTSKDTLKEIAKKLGIGFATNDEDNTDDKQLWICPKSDIKSFIGDVTNHTWKDNQSFYKTWIDVYYNLNFINVNKMLITGDDDIDITAATNITDFQKKFPKNTTQDNVYAIPKMFTNLVDAYKRSTFYVTKWTPINNASKITNKIGSQINTHTFIHNQNIYNDGGDPYSTLTNNQMYDPNKTETYMVLRGRTTYDASSAADGEMSRTNIKTDDINTHNRWCGIQYTLSDDDRNDDKSNDWSGNVNKNYNRSFYHNQINNQELDKLYIKIEVAGACLQVMRGEKVPVFLGSTPGVNNLLNASITDDDKSINKLYSGQYIVDSYKIIYRHTKNNDAGYTNFDTELIMKRREWPIPVGV